MKKLAGIFIFFLLLLSVISGVFSNDSNINQKRAYFALNQKGFTVFRGECSENETSSTTLTLDLFGNEIAPYITTGASPGEAGYGLDIMYLMKFTDPTTPDARKKKEIMELYHKASKGELDQAAFHLSPDVYASMHMNESSGATFLDNYYGEPYGKYSATDMTLSRFTGAMLKELGISGVGSVWKDNGRDGYFDGPFQIEQGAPSDKNNKRISNMIGVGQSASRTFDVVFFPDSLAWINHDFSEMASQYGASFADPREAAMLASAKHNRGSIDRMAWGMPYNTKGLAFASTYVQATNEETYKEARVMFSDMLSAYTLTKPPIVGNDNPSQRALGILLLLKSGWYVESMDNLSFLDGTAGRRFFDVIFPEARGQTPTTYVRANFLKTPWEVIGISKADYGRIYGMTSNSYRSYYAHDFLFKVENYTSSNYKNKLPDGSNPPVVHVWDNVVIGHCAGSALMGETILLNMFIDAGMPPTIDGFTIDPTNPSTAYRTLKQNNVGSYSPMSGDLDLANKFNELVNILEISTTPGRLKSLYHTYEMAGTKYWYGGGGLYVNANNYKEHLKWAGSNQPKKYGATHLNSFLYQDKQGNTYKPGVTKDEDLMLNGRRLFDCAKLAMCGPSLGQTSANGATMRFTYRSGDIIANANSERGEVMLEADDGIRYDVGLYTVASNTTVGKVRDNPSMIPGGLQPGDIIAYEGHAYTVLCIAPKNVVIPASIARSDVDVNIKAGSLVTIEAWSTGEYNRVRDRGWGKENCFIIRTYMMDDPITQP